MTRHATDRLTVAVALSLIGALIAVLAAMPEVALFAAPWMVLCALGMTQRHDDEIEVQVELTKERVLVGDTAELVVRLSSASTILVRLRPEPSRSFGPRSAAMHSEVVELVRGAPSASTEVRFDLPATVWGTHDVGRLAIEAVVPYGLFRVRGVVAQRLPVRVHPTPVQLQELLTPWMVRRVSGTHRSNESAQGIEYSDIREFAAGDSVRDINWRASARTGDIWVSQRHPDRASDVVLLVDSFVESGHDVRAVFGLVVESAVALANSHLSATDRVGLIEFGGVVRWVTPSTGRVQLQRLVDALLATGLYANAADKELPILPSRALPPRSFMVAFTPLLDQRFIDAVFTARARGHDVAVVECAPLGRSPDGPEGGGPEGDRPDAELLARRIWQAERAMVRDRMAEQGIAVAQWDGNEPIDVTLARLTRRRRRAVRVGRR